MLKPDYKALWSTMEPNPQYAKAIMLASQHIEQFKTRYQSVGEKVCPIVPVPWYFIGLIHFMEASQNFNRHLHNGDPLSDRTKNVPAGRPKKGNPPFSWEDSAVDALVYKGYNVPKIWDIDDILARLEEYNGLGYQSKGIYTPYLWSRTNHYTKGKYVKDGKYDPEAVSVQIGAAPILKLLLP